MPLWHFLYRCPECGEDPVEGEGDRIRCPSCGLRCERTMTGNLRILHPGGEEERVFPEQLAERIEALGGPETRATTPDGRLLYRNRAVLQVLREEVPVRHRDLLGYREILEAGKPGVLELSDDHLGFKPEAGDEVRWHLLSVASLQSSSSSVHVRVRGFELAVFVFPDDSPRRWEQLIARALSRSWEEAGRGRIVEFQPRIVVR